MPQFKVVVKTKNVMNERPKATLTVAAKDAAEAKKIVELLTDAMVDGDPEKTTTEWFRHWWTVLAGTGFTVIALFGWGYYLWQGTIEAAKAKFAEQIEESKKTAFDQWMGEMIVKVGDFNHDLTELKGTAERQHQQYDYIDSEFQRLKREADEAEGYLKNYDEVRKDPDLVKKLETMLEYIVNNKDAADAVRKLLNSTRSFDGELTRTNESAVVGGMPIWFLNPKEYAGGTTELANIKTTTSLNHSDVSLNLTGPEAIDSLRRIRLNADKITLSSLLTGRLSPGESRGVTIELENGTEIRFKGAELVVDKLSVLGDLSVVGNGSFWNRLTIAGKVLAGNEIIQNTKIELPPQPK